MLPTIATGNVGSALAGEYEVANSLRFDNDSNDYLSKSASGSTSSNTTWTISFWIKRANLSAKQVVFMHENASSHTEKFELNFRSDDTFNIETYHDGYEYNVKSSALFRDVSAWYNFVVRVDTTQSTESNRYRVYVNGEQITLTESGNGYPTQNFEFNLGTKIIAIGRYQAATPSSYLDGYLSELVYCDGQSLDPTSFGEFDSDTNIWKPIDVSGLTFGNNGFYLDFENSGSLGADVSGNGNNFTVNNLTSIDQTTDTCTNNFATLNSLINFNSGVFSEGNLAITFGDDTVSTIGLTKGRWYWEAQRTNSTNEAHFGIGVSNGFYSATSVVSDGDRLYVRGGTNNFNTASNLSILTFGSNSGTPASFGSGDILSFYLDLESSTKNIIIKKNDGATPLANVDLTYSGEEPIFPFCRMNSGCASSWNFGNPINSLTSANTDANGFGAFEFSPTLSGVDYFAICTKNLAEYG